MSISLIDVRPEAEFLRGHIPGSVGIPLEEICQRVHELPARSVALRVTDLSAERAHRAADFLRKRGSAVEVIALDATMLHEAGVSRTRLWEPSAFLIEALARIGPWNKSAPPRALDVACGSGRDAVFLALNGFAVEAIDLLPDALERAQNLARRNGVGIETRVQDLERNPRLPAARHDLICVFRYLQRSLFSSLRQAVAFGGFIVYETFHERNRETGLRPQHPDHLLKDGELTRAFEGFEMLIARDAVEREGRIFSHVLCRRV